MTTSNPSPPPTSVLKRWATVDHETWRDDLLRIVLRVLSVFGGAVCVPSVAFAIKFHMTGIAVMDVIAISLVFALTYFDRIPAKVRAAWCCAVLYGLGVGLMVGVGSISQIYLFGFSLLTTLLLSVRWGLFTVVLNAVTMLTIGYVGISAPEMMATRWAGTVTNWSIITANFVMVNGCLVLTVGAVIGTLETTIARAIAARRALEDERRELVRLNETLAQEVEERARTESSLRDTRALLRIAGRSARLGGWQMRVGGDHVEWSDEVCEIHQVPLGATPSLQEAMDFYAPEYRKEIRDLVGVCIRDGAPFDFEAEIVIASGERRWIRAIGNAGRDADGAITQVHGSVQDISPQKLAEARHEKLQEQLRQAQKMETVGSLAGGVAHDFNNLVSVVLTYSEMLLDELESESTMRADLEEIRGAGLRATELTRQLLAFSRQQVLAPEVVDLSIIVGGLEKMLRRLLGEDVELTVRCTPELGNILVDPGQMEQVVMNLAVNARDAMPQGGKLTIETKAVTLDEAYASEHIGVTAGTHMMLAVSDTGIGMDKATQARMFEPFYTTKDKSKGTGLGLATVFGIVQQSGGSIWVCSEPGAGTTFKIYFPIASLGDAPPRVVVAAEASVDLRGGETILLVEDDAKVRAVALAILRKYGYDVLEAESGAAAILVSERHAATIDLLVTDVIMPRMSGRQVAESLAASRPSMKVLFMSGYTDDAVVRHGIFDSTIDFVQKPLTPAGLARKVREVLDAPKRTVS